MLLHKTNDWLKNNFGKSPLSMTGHIKLDRKILSWEWYNDINTCRLFIHLLLTANHKEGRWQGNVIGRGQLITGLKKLSENTGLTMMQLRTCFDKLKLTGEITVIVTTKYRRITICKYDTYQSSKNNDNKQNNNQILDETTSVITNEQQTSNKQVTTNKNDKNNKEEESNNRGTGDFASPEPPLKVEAVFRAPDGSLVKVAAFQYSAKDFNGLPEMYSMAISNTIRTIRQIEVTKDRLDVAWEGFKTTEIHKKVYRDKDDVYSFFSNYCKKQPWAKDKEEKTTPVKKAKKDVKGLKFINDFTQCEMSDGSIQKLAINQIELAKYNQISPNSITKK